MEFDVEKAAYLQKSFHHYVSSFFFLCIFFPGDLFLEGRRYANRIIFADFADYPNTITDSMTEIWNNGSVPILTIMLYDPRRREGKSKEVS